MKHIILLLLVTMHLPLFGQEDARAIFSKAADQFVTINMELSMDVQETDDRGRVKERNFDILMARFGEVEKTKMTMNKPERAKGVTIVITFPPDDIGTIEVLTPANGKVRKMKATEDNMTRVGSNFSMASYAYDDMDNLTINLLGTQEVNGKSCYQLEVWESKDSSGLKSEFMVEKDTYHIVQVLFLDESGKTIRVTNLSDFQPVSGLRNKIHPMLISSEDLEGNTQTRIQVLKAVPRPDLKEEDFVIHGTSVESGN